MLSRIFHFNLICQNMRLAKIHIKNFRSIKDSGEIVGITRIFALIGRNNTGKSSILKAIQILLNKRGVEVDDFHKDTTEDIEVLGVLERGSREDMETINLRITCERDGLRVHCFVNDKEVTKTKFVSMIPELLSINDIRNPGESNTGGQKLTLLKQILKLQESTNSVELTGLSSQLEVLKKQESEEISQKISEKFREIINEQTFSISITPEIDLEKAVTHKTGITDADIPGAKTVDILNSGTGLQSMYILTLLEVFAEMSIKRDEAILIVEEPEVYLHPEYQRRMFAALRRIADTNQVIFTTHSPIMIADIWLTESVRQVKLNEDGETQIDAVKIENVIDELGIRYEDVLNPSLVVFVEGKEDVKFLKKLGVDHPKLTVISTDGFRAIHYYAFIKIITSEHVSNKFILIADSDGEDSEQRKENLRAKIYAEFSNPPERLDKMLEGRIYVLNRYSIESYLLEKTTLKKAFPELDADDIDTFVGEYNKKYQEKEKELREGSLTLQQFAKYLKPKLIFEIIQDERFEEAYREFWSESDTFLTVKGLIAQRCKDIGVGGNDPFKYILDNVDFTEIPELIELKDSVLSQL